MIAIFWTFEIILYHVFYCESHSVHNIHTNMLSCSILSSWHIEFSVLCIIHISKSAFLRNLLCVFFCVAIPSALIMCNNCSRMKLHSCSIHDYSKSGYYLLPWQRCNWSTKRHNEINNPYQRLIVLCKCNVNICFPCCCCLLLLMKLKQQHFN